MQFGIPTYPSGIEFDLACPKPGMVSIEDIAHSLSRVHRFNGYTNTPTGYSVAQHCWYGSYFIEQYQLEFLLHDAAEAYIGDLTTMLKRLIGDRIVEIEESIAAAIWEKFGLDGSDKAHAAVKVVDRIMLNTETRDLTDRGMCGPCFKDRIEIITDPEVVRKLFLARFHELFTKRNGVVWLQMDLPSMQDSFLATQMAM